MADPAVTRTRLSDAKLHLGLSDAVVWLSVTLPENRPDRLLEIAYPPLDDISVYVPIGGDRLRVFRGGDRMAFSERKEPHRNYQFPLPESVVGDLLVRVYTESAVIVPVSVWQRRSLERHDRFRLLLQGAYIGAVVVIAAYNFFLFLSLRDSSYVYYVVHVLLYGLYYFVWGGLAFEYLCPDYPVLNNRANPFVAGVGVAAGFLFVRQFLNTREEVPRFDIAIRFIVFTCLLCSGLGLIGFYRSATAMLMLPALFAAVAMPAMGVFLLLRGLFVVRFLLVAWSITLVLTILNTLRILLLVPATAVTQLEGVQAASIIQFILLSLALADRFRLIRREREEARAANAAKTVFLSNMSHEIRTPLNAVIGMAELLDESRLDEPQNTYARSLVSAGHNLLTLVNDVLDIAKIESGRTEIRSAVFDPVSLVTSLQQTIEPGALRKGLMLSWELDAALPEHLLGDEGAIRQVLLNLLSNAVKFTERGGVALSIRAAGSSADSALLRFEVRDTGIGIDRRNQARIFEAFAQADESRSRGYGGTGLGLAISRRLVELMGGHLDLESTPNAGSRFFFELILALPESEVRAPPSLLRSGGPPPLGSLVSLPVGSTREHPVRILLAEDNEENRILIRAFLRDLPHRLVEAHDGMEAEQAFLREPFDVVLMDVQMPRMDGLEAVRRIRQHEAVGRAPRTHRTPIVTLTAYALNEEVDRSLAAGCDEHLTKPIRKADLLAAISRHVR